MTLLTSPSHPLIKHLVKLRLSRAYRYEKKTVLIRGHKMIKDLQGSIRLKTLLTKKNNPLLSPVVADHTFFVTEEILKKVTGVKTPETCAAEVEMPAFTPLKNQNTLLACYQIQDPGNLGTLIRSALAFGIDGIFLSSCVDPFNDKALSSAKGATFSLPLSSGTIEELISFSREKNRPLFTTTLTGPPLKKPGPKWILLLGNESQGLPDKIIQSGVPTTLKMEEGIDSLNVAVAGSILLYAFTQGDL